MFGGKPIIRDMRVSVEFILSLLAQGIAQEDILDDYPNLELDDIHACIAYARAVIAGDSTNSRSSSSFIDGLEGEETVADTTARRQRVVM